MQHELSICSWNIPLHVDCFQGKNTAHTLFFPHGLTGPEYKARNTNAFLNPCPSFCSHLWTLSLEQAGFRHNDQLASTLCVSRAPDAAASRSHGSSIPSSRVTSDVSEISISPSLPHPNNPELWVRSHKSRSLVHWLMRHRAENTTSCLIPGPLLPVTALAFAQQRLTRCSCRKRASIFHTIIFSVLEGKGELCGSAVLQRGQLPLLLELWPTFSCIPKAQLPQSSQQNWIAGAGHRAVFHIGNGFYHEKHNIKASNV